MYPNEDNTHKSKSANHNATLSETQSAIAKNKTKNPPGVSMPPEKEMSPPQLG